MSLSENNAASSSASTIQQQSSNIHPRVHFIFVGGGIYFYWQAGVITYLREQQYDLTTTSIASLTGASAGALTATLMAHNVDYYHATARALDMAQQAGVWQRRGGLQGIWGPLIHDWLDELLPAQPVSMQQPPPPPLLRLLLTGVPRFRRITVSDFRDKEDLIQCNLASVHIPWFLNGKWTTRYRDMRCIDGSFLTRDRDYMQPGDSSAHYIILDHVLDVKHNQKGFLDVIKALSPDGIYQLIEDGKEYAKELEERGEFALLTRNSRETSVGNRTTLML
jgi:hypothetical protein